MLAPASGVNLATSKELTTLVHDKAKSGQLLASSPSLNRSFLGFD